MNQTVLSQSISLPLIHTSTFQIIPSFPRFQWLNHPKVIEVLERFLKPPQRGRKEYDKVLMFRWLIWKQPNLLQEKGKRCRIFRI